ncbi:hypothetical protein PInf_030122 [Phytophthora infestans]|nr:hypothetical protein PInf_030122 [Phytophthora infestans]
MATAKNSGKKPNMYWDKDGVDGGKSSLDVLLDWMTIDTNYNRWHGADRTSGYPPTASSVSDVTLGRTEGVLWEMLAVSSATMISFTKDS